MKTTLTILGSGQDGGVPQPNCFCPNCRRAINNPSFQKTAASLAIVIPEKEEWHLIDCTPDIKIQMLKLQQQHDLEGISMNSIFLTHAHIGHYPGLIFLGKEAMNTHHLPVFSGDKMAGTLRTNAPWSQLVTNENITLKNLTDRQNQSIGQNVFIRPIDVPHRNEFSETFGFWIEGSAKKVLYIPDIDAWKEETIDIVAMSEEADVCLLDGTFYSEADLSHIKRDISQIPHPMITKTMDLLASLAKLKKTEIYFTHFNHSNPVLDPGSEERQELEQRGFQVAYDGLSFTL